MTTYPTQPTGDNSIDLNHIFASNATNKIIMSTEEILDGYNNDGEKSTPLTSTPDGNKFNYFWYQVHNTLAWVVNYTKALFDNKLELSGGTMTGNLALGSNKATSSYVPTTNADLTNKLYVDTAVNGAKWIGEIWEMAYPNIPTLPAGMEVVECDGRALSKTSYPELYSIMGTTWGGTEIGSTFNIPDKRGVVTRGWDHGRGLDSSRVFGSYQESGAPNIVGSTLGGTTEEGTGSNGAIYVNSNSSRGGNGQGGDYGITIDASRSSSEYKNGLSEVRMKNTTGYYVIRIK